MRSLILVATLASSYLFPRRRRSALAPRRATATEDDQEIRWLPPLNPQRPEAEPSEADGTMVLPLFPLGSIAYTPGSTQVLNIFEPRYRKMYSDILMSGGRRFVTTMVNPDEPATLAEVGVVLYLEDLKEVSEQTNDAVKYVCSHRVLDSRVTIHRVLNPAESKTRETYMRCEVSDMTDADEVAEGAPPADGDAAREAAVLEALCEVAALQDEGKEDVRFSREAVGKLAAARGVGAGSLWGVVELWKNFLDARAQAAGRRVQQDVQNRLIKYLSDKSGSEDASQLPQSVNLSELPPDIQRDVRTLRDRVMDDVAPLVDEQTRGVQRLLQCESHAARLDLFEAMVRNEKNRLLARKTLRSTLASLEDKFADDGGKDEAK
mmetsp:Transcript_9304/g.27854  ORF Transcript_9304/g.27854 Transcript_9304/m.27854 type:complete len:378 (+) Transcript_9304:118-1251(+)